MDLQNIKNKLELKKKELEYNNQSLKDGDQFITSDNKSESNELTQVITTNNVISLLERKREKEIQKINLILNKISNGEFGCCADCDEAIEEKRLMANPLAERCVSCQEAAENKAKYSKKVA